MRGPRVLLLVTGSYPPAVCGVGDYTAGLARSLAARGRWQVRVATAANVLPSDDDRRSGVAVLPVFADWAWHRLGSIASQLGAVKADIVHVQLPTQGYGRSFVPWLLPGCLSLTGHRVVQTWHEYIPGSRSLRPLAAALASDEVIVVRPAYEKKIPALHRVAMGRATITHIANPSNIPVTCASAEERTALRRTLIGDKRKLIGYFGFAYPHKRVELLFDVLDPATTRLLLIGRLDSTDPYHRLIQDRMNQPTWRDAAVSTGFVSARQAADMLAACDAVVLPFAQGGGDWNTSLHAVQSQGTFLVTTSTTQRGYLPDENTHYFDPHDTAGMRSALAPTEFRRIPAREHGATWDDVARAHEEVYERALSDKK